MSSTLQDSRCSDVLDPNKGFFLVKALLAREQAERYRAECEQFFLRGRRLARWPGYGPQRVNRDDMYDYVHPASDSSNLRMFQFPHNRHSPETDEIYERALAIRDGVEKQWLHDRTYRGFRSAQGEYVQVVSYMEGQGIDRHNDCKDDIPYPLLQVVLLLSRPQRDFSGGELVLHTRSATSIRVLEELGMEQGDAIFFDKSLDHEVEPTQRSAGSAVGRWTAIIGGRYRRPNILRRVARRTLERARGLFDAGAMAIE